jgi:predicted Zn-dependent peptidase
MKYLLTLFCFFWIYSASWAQPLDRSKAPVSKSAPIIKIGDYQKFELENGLKVFFVQDNSRPVVEINIELILEPIKEGEKAGLSQLAGQMMSRGTTSRSKAQIDEEIETIGSSIFTNSSSMFGFTVVKHLDKFMDIFSDILLRPSFTEKEFLKLRKQFKTNLAIQRTDPSSMASRTSRQIIYGKDHPFGETANEFTIDNIELDDCREYYKKYFRPNVAYLTLVGDLTLEKAKDLVNKYFAEWRKADVPAPTYEKPKFDKGFIALVNKEDAEQSVIDIRQLVDVKPYSDDAFKLQFMNMILGGSGFNSRLFQNLREDKGFTYGAYSSFRTNKIMGSFSCGASVRNTATDSAMREFIYEINRIRNEKPSQDEVDLAANMLTGSFALSLESKSTIGEMATTIEEYNLPKDYYQKYLERVTKVTPDEVQQIAQKFVQPEKMCMMVVGKEKEVKEKLRKFGEVRVFDDEGNEILPVSPEVPAGLTAEEVVETYLKAIGGREKLLKVKTLIIQASNLSSGMEIELNEVRKFPNMMAANMLREGNTLYQKVYNGLQNKGFYTYKDKDKKAIRDVLYDASLEMASVEAFFFDELYYKLKNYRLKLSKKTVQVGSEICYEVKVTTPAGTSFSKYYSKRNGLLLQVKDYKDNTYTYDKYKFVDGIKFPFLLRPTTPVGPLDVKVNAIKINEEVGDTYFKTE